MKNCGKLANAIVLQAYDDYEYAVSILCTKYMNRELLFHAKNMKYNCECFFKSKWYEALSGVSPSYVKGKIDDLILNAPYASIDPVTGQYKCPCGNNLGKRVGSSKRPIIRCTQCDIRVRVYGEPVHLM